jgi:DNA polymerase III delta subunit
MPKYEPKLIQSELEKGQFRSVYVLYGLEVMKMRELTKRITNAYLGRSEPQAGSDQEVAGTSLSREGFGFSTHFAELQFDGPQTTATAILEEMVSLTLGVSEKVILLKNAHQLKDLEALIEKVPVTTFTNAAKENAILILWARDLDQRKKSTKLLMEKAAVIPCEVIAEKDRAPWIRYLMKRRPWFSRLAEENGSAGLTEFEWLVEELLALEPWTLDIVDRALEQFELTPESLREEAFKTDLNERSPELFVQSLLKKDLKSALFHVSSFSSLPEESLPLLGLIAWNFRMLASVKLGTHAGKSLMGGTRDRMREANGQWTLSEILKFQERLTNFDSSLKGSGEDAHAAWVNLVRSSILSSSA